MDFLPVEIFLFSSPCPSVFLHWYLIVCSYKGGKSVPLFEVTYSNTYTYKVTVTGKQPSLCLFVCLLAFICLILGLNL